MMMSCSTLTGNPAGGGGWHNARAALAGIFFAGVSFLLVPAAEAQRAGDNAVTAASDAFGTVVGNQTIGLYSPTNARGFNPTQAQNVRIEGLYFDQQTSNTDPVLFTGSDMRVGISAQSYAFPSPSGIADLKLRSPGNAGSMSLVLQRGPLENYSAEVDTQYPVVTGSLSVGLNVIAAQNFDYDFAQTSARRGISTVIRFRPAASAEFIPFFAYMHNFEHNETPFVFADRIHPLPLFDEQHLPTQIWTTWGWNQSTGGLIAKVSADGPWTLRAGLFESVQQEARNYNDLYLGLLPDGTAPHVLDVPPARSARSYSGDLRLVRSISSDVHHGELTFTARGRLVNRTYGGDSLNDLGTISIHDGGYIPPPPLTFSAQSRDEVRQAGLGVNYTERYRNIATASLGMLVTDYNRKLRIPGTTATDERTRAILPTASFTVSPVRAVTLYGSYTRGLEDSVIAPTEAVNRGEPPPATPTWQVDGGARIVIRPQLQLLVGAFNIHKTYFGLDSADRFTEIGAITARGVESSATLTGPDGLTLVAGGVWLQPRVTRNVPEKNGAGETPVGPVPRTININFDYAPSYARGLAATMKWTSLSARVETGDGRYRLPPLATLNLGVRYEFKILDRPCTVRLDAENVTNASGLTITSTYVVVPQLRRNYMLTFAADI